MRLLMVCPAFPYPPQTGGDLRVFNLIKALSREHDIKVMSVVVDTPAECHLSTLRQYCSSVEVAPVARHSKLSQLPTVVARLLKGEPFTLKYVEAPRLKEMLGRISDADQVDIVQFEHSYMAHYIRYLPPHLRAKKILSLHNVACAQYFRIYQNERNLAKKMKYLMEWAPMLRWEPKMTHLFDKALVVSESDRHLLQFLNNSLDISVIPNGVDSQKITPYPLEDRGNSLIFVGSMDYEPNSDAVLYFSREIFPLVKRQLPGIKMIVVGRDPSPEVRSLAQNTDITVTGRVDDVLPFYKEALLSVVPLRSGGGTRLKIMESLATGTPVVSTTIGCEGLETKDGEHLLVADRPEQFADRIVRLYRDPQLWKKISEAGRSFVVEKYDWHLIGAELNGVYQKMLVS